jgi:hypothetical protein
MTIDSGMLVLKGGADLRRDGSTVATGDTNTFGACRLAPLAAPTSRVSPG